MTDTPPLDEHDELWPVDEDELRRAEALARALDAGRAEPGLPEAELEAAALLRLSSGAVRLDERRQRELRAELLASLPREAPRTGRARLPRWLLVLLPPASALAAYVLWVTSERPSRRDAPAVASQAAEGRAEKAEAAPLPAASGSARAATSGEPLAGQAGAAAPRGELALAEREGARAGRTQDGDAELGLSLSSDARRALTQSLAREVRAQRGELLARAGDARLARAHAELDAARTAPQLARSQRTLTELSLALGDAPSDADGRVLRQDVYCRLAETALRLGEPHTALEWTRRGLALDGPPTAFLAQLEALEGDAWAALGENERAARGYMRALGVYEQLLGEELDGR